jgi:hypothetical protein
MKTCRICKVDKPYSEFYHQKRNADGYKTECKTCAYEQHKTYRENGGREIERANAHKRRAENPDADKNRHYIRKYGISAEQYNELLELQNGVCKLCKQPEHIRSTSASNPVKRLAVDHDHNTGKVRGLLCHNCNVMLGQYEKWKDRFPIFEEYIKGPGFYSNGG